MQIIGPAVSQTRVAEYRDPLRRTSAGANKCAPRSFHRCAALGSQLRSFRQNRSRRQLHSQAPCASAFTQAEDAVKQVTKAFDPKAGEAPPMDGKTIILTGGNAGLGFETAKSIVKAGGHVILASRNLQNGQEAADQLRKVVAEAGSSGSLTPLHLDLASLRSVHDFSQQVSSQCKSVHVLFNNAGEFAPEDKTTEDGFEVTIGTNHFGHWYLTQLMVPLMKNASEARVVWTTSPSETQTPDIDFDNLESKGKASDLTQYGLSKLYNILSMKEFHKRLLSAGIENFAAQPGIAKTKIFDKIPPDVTKPVATFLKNAAPIIAQTAEEGARGLTYAGTSPDMKGKGGDVTHIVGPFYGHLPGLPFGMANIANLGNTAERFAENDRAYNDDLAAKLYDKSGEIISQKIAAFDSGRSWP